MHDDDKKIEKLANELSDGIEKFTENNKFDTEDSEKIAQALKKINHAAKIIRKQSEAVNQCILENDHWAHLKILAKIGKGGIGEVYLAYDSILDCKVAVKFLNQNAQLYISAKKFLQEARTMAKVRHPHVLAIHGATIDNNIAGYWSDYLDGELLSDKLKTQKLDFNKQLQIATQLAQAVKQIHQNNIVHGDIKTQNIILQAQRGAILLDFGSSRKHEETGNKNESFQASPMSMAPEQFAGFAPSQASDIFSLGLVFWQLNTSCNPISMIEGENKQELAKQLSQLSNKKQQLQGTKAWKNLILNMLEKEAKHRPNISEVVKTLTEIAEKPLKRAKKISYLTVLILAISVAAISLFSNYKTKQANAQSSALNAILSNTLVKSSALNNSKTLMTEDVLSDAQQMLIDSKTLSKSQKIQSLLQLLKTYQKQQKTDKAIALSGYLLTQKNLNQTTKKYLLLTKSLALLSKNQDKKAQEL